MNKWAWAAASMVVLALLTTMTAYFSDRSNYLSCLNEDPNHRYVCGMGEATRFAHTYMPTTGKYPFFRWFPAFARDSKFGRGVRVILWAASAWAFIALILEVTIAQLPEYRGAGARTDDEKGPEQSMSAIPHDAPRPLD